MSIKRSRSPSPSPSPVKKRPRVTTFTVKAFPELVEDDAHTLVCLLDDLASEDRSNGSFYNNRAEILVAFKENRLYVIRDHQIEHSEKKPEFGGARFDPPPWRSWHVPSFAVMKGTTLEMLWVREDWRGFGYGRAFAEALGVERLRAIPQAQAFWEHLGFGYEPIRMDGTDPADGSLWMWRET